MERIDMRKIHCPTVGTIVAQIFRERPSIHLLIALRNRGVFSWIWGIVCRCPRKKIFFLGLGEIESIGFGSVPGNLGLFWTLLAGIHDWHLSKS